MSRAGAGGRENESEWERLLDDCWKPVHGVTHICLFSVSSSGLHTAFTSSQICLAYDHGGLAFLEGLRFPQEGQDTKETVRSPPRLGREDLKQVSSLHCAPFDWMLLLFFFPHLNFIVISVCSEFSD